MSSKTTLPRPQAPDVVDSERTLSGSILLEPERVRKLARAAGVTADTFSDGVARRVFAAAVRLIDAGRLAEPVEVQRESALDAATVQALIDNTPTAAHAEYHIEIVRAAAVKRDALRQIKDADGTEALRLALRQIEATLPSVEGAGGIQLADFIEDPPPPHDPVLGGLLDVGGLLEVVGSSKSRKTFAAYQLCLGLATGRDVFGFNVPRPFSVLYADMELTEADTRRRLIGMARALGIRRDGCGRFTVLNLAGCTDPKAKIEAAASGYDVLVVDPLYAVGEGGETIEDLRPAMAWLRRMASLRAAVLYVHHDAKGLPGERATRDRGSGSNITGRAVDARIAMTPAAADPDGTAVMRFMCRSYVTPLDTVWTFSDGCFIASDMPAEAETYASTKTRKCVTKLTTYEIPALRMLRERGSMSPATFKQALREELGISKGDADVLTARLVESGQAMRARLGGFTPSYQIGLPGQLPELPGKRAREAG